MTSPSIEPLLVHESQFDEAEKALLNSAARNIQQATILAFLEGVSPSLTVAGMMLALAVTAHRHPEWAAGLERLCKMTSPSPEQEREILALFPVAVVQERDESND